MEYNYVHYGHEAGATELSEQKRWPLVLSRILSQLEFNPTLIPSNDTGSPREGYALTSGSSVSKAKDTRRPARRRGIYGTKDSHSSSCITNSANLIYSKQVDICDTQQVCSRIFPTYYVSLYSTKYM